MSLVQVAMESSQFGRARQLLNQQRPAAGQSDFRGFEWHYWQRELDRSRLRSVDAPLLAAANRISSRGWPRIFSKGAQRLVACLEYPRDSPLYTGAGLMVVFDGLTGREVVAPFDPCTDVPAGHRDIRFSMSDDGTRLAASIAVRTDGATAGQPAQITIRDGLTGSEIRRIVGPAGVAEIALSADGSRLAVEYIDQADLQNRQTASGQSGVKVWDTSTGELLKTLPLLPYTSRNRILLSPDGQRLLRQSVSRDRDNERVSYREQFQVVEVTSGTVLWDRPFPSHFSDPRRAWGWSPSGKLIVVFEVDEPDMVAKPNAQLWDSATGTTLAKLDRETVSNPSATSNLAFSADSQLLAVASTTNEIYVWKIPELPAAAASPLHVTAPYLTLQSGEEVNGIAFTADSRELQCATATSIITLDATAREDAGLGPDLMDVLFSSAISADAMKVAFG